MNNKLQLIEINPNLQEDIQDVLKGVNIRIEYINNNYLNDFSFEELSYIKDYVNKLISDLCLNINIKIKERNQKLLTLSPNYLEEFDKKLSLLERDLSKKNIFSS
ncbi:MAG: hypothetical protein ACI33S_03765, partial [Bacilli bacterium]